MNASVMIPPNRAGYVYAIRSNTTDAVKIGFSASPIRRLRQLQTGSPDRLSILCAIPAFQEYEATLHTMFAPRRKHGEWFDDADGFVSSTMVGTAAFLRRAGLTFGDIESLSDRQPDRISPRDSDLHQIETAGMALLEHADALEAEGQLGAAA